MKPTQNNIIIQAVLDQKESLTYKSLKLYVPFKHQYNPNGREGNPVLAEVIGENPKYPELVNGDIIVTNHNTINNKAFELCTVNGVRTLSIPADRYILGKIGSKGELLPLFGNIIAQRISEVPVSSIIITPDAYKKTDPNRMIALAVSKEVSKVLPGETIICYPYSDYECVYYIDGEERRTIVIWKDDILITLKEAA